MDTAFVLSLGLTVSTTAPSSVGHPLQESVEWLCARADRVVVGRVVSAADLQGGGKSRDLMHMVVEGRSLAPTEGAGTFAIGLRGVPLAELEHLRDTNASFVLFLRQTQQAFAHEGRSVDLWPLRTEASGHWVYPLGPEAPLLSAREGALTDLASLEATCAASMQAHDGPAYPGPARAFLPVPSEASTAAALGDRTPPAYLIVPADSFPEALKTPPTDP